MYKANKYLHRGVGKSLLRVFSIGLATLSLAQFNTAIAAAHLNYDSDGNRFNLINSERLDTVLSADQVWLSGDFDGNGMDDLIQISEENNTAKVVVHASDGENTSTYITQRLDAGFWSSQRWLVGNFNNDRYDDLVLIYSYKGTATAWIYSGTGTGFTKTSTQRLNANFWNEQRWEIGDFDGDDNDDIVLVYSYFGNATAWIYSSTGTGFVRTSTQRLGGQFRNSDRWKVGNFNGDEYDDLIRINSSGLGNNTDASIFTSGGQNFTIRTVQSMNAGFWAEQRWEVGDVNADNMDDVILIYGHNPGGATAWMYRSTGTRVSRPTTQRLNWTFLPDYRWLVTDLNGDGRAGLALLFENDPR